MQFTAFDRFVHLVGNRFGEAQRPDIEEENGSYESGIVLIGSEMWRLRTARVTPSKPGAFVALWTRNKAGETQPFGCDDQAHGLLLFVEEGDRFGVFRFSSAHLHNLGVTRSPAHSGKRGFRVYPSWSVGLNRQATQTQKAQSSAFLLLE